MVKITDDGLVLTLDSDDDEVCMVVWLGRVGGIAGDRRMVAWAICVSW